MCNIAIMLEQVLIYAPLICGAYLVLSLMKIPDLSLQSSFVFGGVCAGMVIDHGHGGLPGVAGLAIFASLLGGALVGCAAGLITQVGRVPHLLTTIVITGLIYGVTLYLLGGASHTYAYNPLEQCLPGGYLVLGAFIGLVVLFVLSLFLRSPLGCACAAYGDNPLFLSKYAISTRFVFVSGCAFGNALAGLSGYLFAQSSGFVDITMGTDVALLCITMLMMGTLVLADRMRVTVLVPVAGAVVYGVVQQVLLAFHLDPGYFTVVQALVVLVIAMTTFAHPSRRPSAHDHLGV